MDEKEWIVIDQNHQLMGEYPTYAEALEVAATLESYGLRCDIQPRKKENA